jgi:hypothetical protein
MSGDVSSILIGLGGVAIGAAASIITTRLTIVSKYNTALHEKRIEAYSNLLGIFYRLRLHGRERSVCIDDIKHTMEDLVRWYYNNGGIFLSRSSQSKWTEIVRHLEKLTTESGNTEIYYLPWEKFVCLYDKCSEFRTGLSKDIGSRLEYLGKKEVPSKKNPQHTDEKKSYDKLYFADIIIN